MTYAGEDIAALLKAARETRGLTQRALGQSVGLPQSHVSKIEAGAVDLKLSSLLELARALDLDLVLVPRKFVPAVRSIIQNAQPSALDDRPVIKEVRRLQEAVAAIRKLHPEATPLRRLEDTARDLSNIRLGASELVQVSDTQRLLKRIGAGKARLEEVLPYAETLRQMRNRLVHNISEPTERRPAYNLDGEGDDA